MSSEKKICVILTAGGTGSRMQSAIPKQFLLLNGIPIALHSFDLFASIGEVHEIVVVCAQEYQHLFTRSNSTIKITFALPGERRQDSVSHGLQAITMTPSYVCIHDAARPFITAQLVERVVVAAVQYGAAAAGMPIKFTLKERDINGLVVKTPDRSRLWEIQTPQVIRHDLLQQGFAYAYENNLTVTDDVSLIEKLGLPVQLVEGCYRNIKVTTPEDLIIANAFIMK